MNSEAQKTSSQFYQVIIGVALLMAFILSPTPDMLTLMLACLITVTGSLLAGLAYRGWRGEPSTGRRSVFTALIVGILASSICLLSVRYLPALF